MIGSTTRKVTYTGDGATSVYSYTWRIDKAADLTVTQVATDGTATVLALGVDYTVSGVGLDAGGDVTLLGGNLPVDELLVLERVVELVQETDILSYGEFRQESVEEALDRTVMIAQQLADRAGTTGDGTTYTTSPDTRPTPGEHLLGRWIYVKDSGQPGKWQTPMQGSDDAWGWQTVAMGPLF